MIIEKQLVIEERIYTKYTNLEMYKYGISVTEAGFERWLYLGTDSEKFRKEFEKEWKAISDKHQQTNNNLALEID